VYRKIPIDSISDALTQRIRAKKNTFPEPIEFADQDEFWNLETSLSALKLPCVVVEFVSGAPTQANRDVVKLELQYRLNYLCRTPDAGGKRSGLLAGGRALAEIFSEGTDEDPWGAGLTLSEPGVDQAEIDLGELALNPGLSDKNVGWAQVGLTVTVLSKLTGA
jgi:hypothetical protein